MAYQERKQNRQSVREGKERPLPINLRKTSTEVDKTGFIVLRMSGPVPSLESLDLKELARVSGFSGLSSVLEKHPQVPGRRLISSKSPKELENVERISSSKKSPPLGSLAQFWRLDCRNIPEEMKAIAQELKLLKELDLVYLENAVSLPASPITNPYSAGQGYLNKAPDGIDAKWAWDQTNGDGAGVAFVDLEQGWFLDHEDLAAKNPTLIFNNAATDLDSTYHGTAVLGEVIGVNNNKGIVGVANGVTSVRLVSYYDSATNSHNVADAVRAATDVMAPGDVLLLEVQTAQTQLPTETDPAVFVAIQRAVAYGIIVVEAAGNYYNDLDEWTNDDGRKALNRTDPAFQDSGAIMVGAAISELPHDRWYWSNYGSRIDCYAWGENIVTTGYGDLYRGTDDNSAYTNTFGGTSGAAAIIAGAALIVQGKRQATTGRLSPAQMRDVLSNPAAGTAQGGNVAGYIGVMPDLSLIV